MTAKKGDKVKVEYTGKLDDGTVFDTSEGRQPLEFEVGAGQVIPGFDAALTGMKIGDEKDIDIKAQDAYGKYDDKKMQKIPKTQVPNADQLKKGMTLLVGLPTGQKMPVSIKDIDAESITIDLNHPLAGKNLHFHIKLVEIR